MTGNGSQPDKHEHELRESWTLMTTAELMRIAKLRRAHACACGECFGIAGTRQEHCHECRLAECDKKQNEGCSKESMILDKWYPVK